MLYDELFDKIELAARRIRLNGQQVLDKHNVGLTIEQWQVLQTIAQQSKITQKRLVKLLNKDKPTLSRMVKALTREGFIERQKHPEDKRKEMLMLSAKGAAFYTQHFSTINQNKAGLALNIDESEEENLKRLLQYIIDQF